MSKKIRLDDPNIGELEKQYVNKAIDSGYISTVGPFVSEFEGKFSSYLSVKKAVSTQSGTTAIHMALHELGIGKGDEVIVPALTFIANVNPVMYVGATPVFVDVDKKSWNIDPEEIEKSINKNTKAIIPVNLYGNPCDIYKIAEIAKKHNIYFIEDATESLGARYKGRYVGTFGDFGCFSFNGNKIITTGGGGMVIGNNEKRLEHIKFLVNQARDPNLWHYHTEIGFNYRMTNLEASLGLAQLERLNEFLIKKRNFHNIYKDEFKNIGNIRFQEEYKNAESSRWFSCIIFDKKVDIPGLQKELKNKEISTRRIFMPITEFPPYRIYKKKKYKNSYDIYEKGLCLPSSTLNTDDDIRDVCRILKEVIRYECSFIC